ncbi:MAG: CRISPR-associated protein Cas4 [Thermoguttaceae bacterium]
MSYADDQLLAISGLQHLVFCERQCALIHMEQIWTENYFSADGRLMHERVHSDESETRGDLRIVRGLPLASKKYGLVGIADVVELHRNDVEGCAFPKRSGKWTVYPVEYKRGKKKSNSCDEVQLCAQALCLEEMLDTKIPEGALYYGQTNKRSTVVLSEKLRNETILLAQRFHELMKRGVTPPPKLGPHCKSCSLVDDCLPELSNKASTYLEKMIEEFSRAS